MGFPQLTVRDIAFVAIFAALSVVVEVLLPGIPIIGVSGAQITLDAVLAPIYGLVLGPYLGALAALIGGLVVARSPFSVLTSFCPCISAFVAGMITKKYYRINNHSVNGWMIAAATLGLLILGWYFTWVGLEAPFYPVLHLIGLVIILVLQVRLANFFLQGDKGKLTVAVALSSYCGLISDHMLGNLIFISVIGWLIPVDAVQAWLTGLHLPTVGALFMYVLPISAVERGVMTVVATLIGVSLILALRAARFMPRREEI
ncbi:MAG: ECF transporter S component [Candidatus Bathyarchaeia archaeon]